MSTEPLTADELAAIKARDAGPWLSSGFGQCHHDRRALLAEVERLRAQIEAEDPDPCIAEVRSWSIFRPEQVDDYWIRCTEVGDHKIHKDSNTGATWH